MNSQPAAGAINSWEIEIPYNHFYSMVLVEPRLARENLPAGGPFDPQDEDSFRRWRDAKLAHYPKSAQDLIVEVGNPAELSPSEEAEIRRLCRIANMAIYAGRRSDPLDKDVPRRLGERFGLRRLDRNPLSDEDGITSLRVVPDKGGKGYIPYTDRRLLWHTDGYYNPPERRIRAFILHCARPAAEGGENALLDPEIVYILLREADPAYIRALMAPDAMTVPPNTDESVQVRGAQSGPVFSVDEQGNLHMRYTARTRSIVWKDDPATEAARRFLERLLESDSPYVFRHRLRAGEGLIANNVLHNRAAFRDDPDSGRARLVYRARYYDRIAGTDLTDITAASAETTFAPLGPAAPV